MTLQRIARVVSGGQTGADRGALDAALASGTEYGGWCPAGGWAEDRTEAPGLLRDYPLLREAPALDPCCRTQLNVRDSHATLVVRAAHAASPGTDRTVACAQRLGRPHLVTCGDLAEVEGWLHGLGWAITLNVAGPREREQPGVYRVSRHLLDRLLENP